MKISSLITLILPLGLTICFHLMMNSVTPLPQLLYAQADSVAADSSDKIYTEEEFLKKYVHDPCDPTAGIQMKIFVPDSTLTESMPILKGPTVDEGIFIPYYPYHYQPCIIGENKQPEPKGN
ncbi:MAG: hypothetical protein EA359_01285 [Balneolaceae bacterium]|nr:MAG: hypothetical protein EA359_01285 [Balneolaceae bacterium]